MQAIEAKIQAYEKAEGILAAAATGGTDKVTKELQKLVTKLRNQRQQYTSTLSDRRARASRKPVAQ